MSPRPGLACAAILSAMAANATVQAATMCPAIAGGHPLRALGGGTLYEGPVKDNASLAPDESRAVRGGFVNTWKFDAAPNVTLVCQYEGASPAVSIVLPKEIRSCRQDAKSFVCQ